MLVGALESQGLPLTVVGIIAVALVLAGLALLSAGAGRVFIARARARARRLRRTLARPGLPEQEDEAATVAAIAVALASAEETTRHPFLKNTDGASPRAGWTQYGRQRLMDNRPRQGT